MAWALYLNVICIFDFQIAARFEGVNHPIASIWIRNNFLHLSAKDNKAEAGLVQDDKVIALVHEAFNRRLPELIHLEHELDETVLHLYNEDHVLI